MTGKRAYVRRVTGDIVRPLQGDFIAREEATRQDCTFAALEAARKKQKSHHLPGRNSVSVFPRPITSQPFSIAILSKSIAILSKSMNHFCFTLLLQFDFVTKRYACSRLLADTTAASSSVHDADTLPTWSTPGMLLVFSFLRTLCSFLSSVVAVRCTTFFLRRAVPCDGGESENTWRCQEPDAVCCDNGLATTFVRCSADGVLM